MKNSNSVKSDKASPGGVPAPVSPARNVLPSSADNHATPGGPKKTITYDLSDTTTFLVKELNLNYLEVKWLWILRKVFHWVITSPAAERVGSTTFKKIAHDISKGKTDRAHKVTAKLVAKCFERFKQDGILQQVVVRNKNSTQYIVLVPGMGKYGVQWEINSNVFSLFISKYSAVRHQLDHSKTSDRHQLDHSKTSDSPITSNQELVTSNQELVITQKPSEHTTSQTFSKDATISPIYYVLGTYGLVAKVEHAIVVQLVAEWGIGDNLKTWRDTRKVNWNDRSRVIATFKILYYIVRGIQYTFGAEDLKDLDGILKARYTVGQLIDSILVYLSQDSDTYAAKRGFPCFIWENDIMQYIGVEVPLAMGVPYGTKLYVSLPNGEYRMCYKNHDMMNVTVKSDREAFENARVIPDGDVKTYGYAVRTLEVK